jgi:hypothetical protein
MFSKNKITTTLAYNYTNLKYSKTKKRNSQSIIAFALILLLSHNYIVNAQTMGCTQWQAINYNASATTNDGSCVFANTNITLSHIVNLDSNSIEISGLQIIDNKIWGHNDGGNANKIFEIDTTNGNCNISKSINASNTDWEDITQDSANIYLGDFGNNNGMRQDLKIIKINKDSFKLGSSPIANSSISFNYNNQTTFLNNNFTNFDCEAIICVQNKLYLFTKNWGNHKTNVYQLPTDSANATALLIDSFDCKGLITGAAIFENKIALLGYDTTGASFAWLLWDYKPSQFFSGNKRRIDFGLSGGQCEGIAFKDSNTIFIANESYSIFKNRLASFSINEYLKPKPLRIWDKKLNIEMYIKDETLYFGNAISEAIIYNLQGQIVARINNKIINAINLKLFNLSTGIYFIKSPYQNLQFVLK